MNRRAVVAWTLYDFANSAFAAVVFATIYAAYYALAVVGNDHGDGDLWWGRVVSASMAIVAVTSPFLGGIADRAGVRRPLFIGFTALAVAATALMSTVEPGMLAWGFVLGVLGNVGYESALVYYNAYLPDLAPPGYRGRLSGWGFAVGYAGSIVALLVAFPFVRAKAYSWAFLTTAALYAVFSVPAFVLLPQPAGGGMPIMAAARAGAAEVIATARAILRHRDLRRFLGAYLLYEDGVNTVVAFSGIFAAQTLGFPMTQLIVLYIVVQVSALIGALCWAGPTDRLGPKRVVMITLCQWTAVVVAAFFVETQTQFWALAVLAGTGLGAVQAASRAFLTSLIPPGMEGALFGFYSLCGKSAAVLGPLVFGGISHAAGGDQRAGILSVGAFFLVGLVLLAPRARGRPRRSGAGIQLKTDILLIPMSARWADMRAAALAVEEAGFDGVWTWDHLRDPEAEADSDAGVPEAMTVLAALAEVTRRIALGPLVLNVSNRHPGLLAQMAATLQQISGGRLLLGLGAGGHRNLPYAAEQQMLGLDVESDAVRAQRVAEAADVMRRLWRGDGTSLQGAHYRLERPSGYLRVDPAPPIVVGGFGPRMAAIAGRHADGFNTQARHPNLAGLLRIARDEHRASGRDPARFVATVFAGLEPRWLRASSPDRSALEGLGVDRLILLVSPPFDPAQIRAAGRMLTPAP